MSSNAHKLCLVGEPGAGKTSLVMRLRALLSDGEGAPAAANGITVTRLQLPTGEDRLDVTLWDVAGRSAVDTLNQAFLSGVDGVMAVADGSRLDSIAIARRLLQHVAELYPDVPAMLVLNKSDLGLASAADRTASTTACALDGDGVTAAFAALGARMAARSAVRAQ
jgi:small GTP-binding protein